MRIERVVLEHHSDVALFGRDVIDNTITDGDFAASDIFKPSDHAQQSGFSAARWADEDHKFTIIDLDVDAMDDLSGSISLLYAANFYGRHSISLNSGYGPTARFYRFFSSPAK